MRNLSVVEIRVRHPFDCLGSHIVACSQGEKYTILIKIPKHLVFYACDIVDKFHSGVRIGYRSPNIVWRG